MSEENKEKQKSLPVTDFYDLVFKIDSFRNLQKKEQGDYGWDILYSKDFDYDKRTQEELVRIGVLGNGNRGKSFILSKLTNHKVPSGFSIKTEGISLKYPDMKTKDGKGIVIIDSAGFEIPLLESFDCKLDSLSDFDAKEAKSKINDLVKDRAILEFFILKYVLQYSDIIIAVVGQLTYSEQQLLLRIKREVPRKKIFIVHNLLNLETKQQVTDYIDNVLKKSLTFQIDEIKMTNLDQNKNVDDTVLNQTYYHEQYTDNNDNTKLYTIEHLIMAKEGTEAGNYYNQSAIDFLSTNTTTTTKLYKYPVKATIKNSLYKMSSDFFDFFESSIPKDNIIVGEVTIDNIKKNKLYIDGYNKDIILKSINIDSLGFSSFLGRSYQPSYCLYIVDNVDKLPIKKTKSEGRRKINKKETEINPNRYDCYYSSIKEGLFSLCISIKPENIYLDSTVPIFKNYENGLLTYYYIGSKSEGETEEIELDV